MSLNSIVTPLDSAILETKDQYKVYFKIVNHAFKNLQDALAKNDICNPIEVTFIKQYCELLTYSLEAFRIKYLFDDEEKMRVDLTESGFPNYLEFRYLINDLSLRYEHLNKLPQVETLKKEFLETLLKDREHISERKLRQAASIIYYTSVDKNYIFRRFIQGKIITNINKSDGEFMVSWSFYDITLNRAFICFLNFDLYKESVSEYTPKIYEVLEDVANRSMSLDMMAYAIDKKLPKLLPKKLKVMDFGPLHNIFAKDELDITHVLLQGIVDKTVAISAYAISISIDEIYSSGNFSEGNIFNRQELQLWEHKKRQKYLFTSHRVMQLLYDKIPETLHSLTIDPIEIPELKLN
ncbi:MULTISPECIES: hypothetical protein [Aequorivita]|uniref:Uncharacterized protein n=2 Tax=Aequorivita TaxID=153265 RepID=A0AB35YKT5_9FLAO|nr:hypothetical protein [Aequorivita sp. Ant34-E75]WGF92026.1 hypothetical protein QCQ61_12520 [Aequorivita sp. Ant34-E75]